MPPLLRVRDLRVALRQHDGERTLLSIAGLDVRAGRITALAGPSGSGKSTLIRAVAGILPDGAAAAGSILVEGVEQIGLPHGSRRALLGGTIGVALQDPFGSFDPMRTLGAHFRDVLAAQRRKGEYPARALAALAACGLPQKDALAAYPFELSGGQLQRAGLALALVAGPKLLLADEITTALDVVTQRALLDDLRALARDTGLGLLLVTHDRAVAKEWADELVEIGGAQPLNAPAFLPAAPMPAAVAPVEPPLAARGLSLAYRRADGGQVDGLAGVDFSVRSGDAVAIVGRSGAGKSTLLACLAGLASPSAGSVLWNGEEIAGMPRATLRQRRRRVQTIFQNALSTFDPRWRVADIVAEPLDCFGIAGDRREQVGRLLRSVGLDAAFAARRPEELSGGEQQRVAIARALAAGPDVLLCDEPVSSLDAEIRDHVLGLIAELRRRLSLTLVFVTHDIGLVPRIAERVVVMDAGRIVDDLPVSQLAHAAQPATRALIAAVPGGLLVAEPAEPADTGVA